ncbi:serine hydrolase domain-containing protein [Microbacterium dextranolyticum]|uniref:Penicillin-binding protein n=1 Tax=Microbacterium dextranolyticum TaxID=36806 RepID=A0A9W6HLA2_9MICO|nr:serine hydrolase domain-containing protein [Microbacterium dextranolyticum]MBM7464263.1 CubicO group peptidase (beta-lactamase class C family) [Microbacterium dextranolyticum]GLJ95257.1 penicillin-binding protein [Microbacterium dextranolyticum]
MTEDASFGSVLEQALSEDVRRLAIGGIAAVVRDGSVIAVHPFGELRRDGGSTARGSVFRVASITKSFLAATALSLRDEGRLDLHAPLTAYLPEMSATRLRGAPVEIALDDLLSNRSGLPEDNPWGDEHLGASREEIGALIAAGLQLSAAPGERYQYSNVGMSLVGRVIEAVEGRPVEQVVSERILVPLGLSDTRWDAAAFPAGADLAAGFRTFDDGATFAPEPYVGSGALACIGSLFSTVDDIGRWVGFLASAFEDAGATGSPEADAVLSRRSRREMQRVHTVNPARITRFGDRPLLATGYGYGLVVEHDDVHGVTVGHSGGLPGFAAHMRWHPESRFGVVAFGNSDAFPAWQVTASALDALLSARDAPAVGAIVWPQTRRAAGAIDEAIRHGASFADLPIPLARNVLRDIPTKVRDDRLRALIESVGAPLTDPPTLDARVVAAPEASTLRWRIPTARGALVCSVHLMGLSTPIVQAIDVSPETAV